jgi:predicted  nucleic acid-binding Zn-ribbon protein
MLEVLEKLLILQDRDRKLIKVQEELAHIPHERADLALKGTSTQAGLDAAKTRQKQIESERKRLELEVEGKKQQIDKYGLQQFQTKKNEEYRALAHEIEMCKDVIKKLEDQQLELMEQGESAQKELATASHAAAEAKKVIDSRMSDLAAREKNLLRELDEAQKARSEAAGTVDDSTRSRYDRLVKNKGTNVVVGIQHGVCGGCHMQLNRSTVVACQGEQEIVTCSNCGRILYYTRDMDVAVTE